MNFSKLRSAIVAALGICLAPQAMAIDLYVDTKTKQIYAEPGKHRVKMGTFERVEDAPQRHHDEGTSSGAGNKAEQEEIAEIKEDLELKTNEIKALEEHIAANREDRAKNDEKWFNKMNLRGYTQLRFNQPLSGDSGAGSPELRSPGDSGIKDNSNFSFRRVRLVFSGDITDYLYLYIQPDFASNVSDTQQNFAQLRDAYADIAFDKAHEYRIRAGQSKVPFSWENLQSSQNRIALDRADAINSAVPSERDLGLFAYWTPTDVQKLWKTLSKKGLKTSGDYGIIGAGIYNGQGINRAETNDDLYVVAHTTYPMELNFLGYPFNGQVLEVGADFMTGYFNTTTADITEFGTNKRILKTDLDRTFTNLGQREDRYAVHAILFPQPFGLQAEWTWGDTPTLNTDGRGSIRVEQLSGGYVQAMYKIDKFLREDGTLIPYVKWQTYDGGYKAATNAPRVKLEEIDIGVEYQIMKTVELTLAYANMRRTNVSNLGRASGDLLRAQLQWNY